jgi:cysteine desulfurase/selenocysteine lyase
MDSRPSLVPRTNYEALRECTYLNQASLGLVPTHTVDAMVAFLRDVAQHGNLRLSDDEEARVLDELRAAAGDLLDAPESGIAVTGGASEALGQAAAVLEPVEGSVVLVTSDFPSVTYPWLAERERRGTPIVWVDDTPETDLTEEIVRAIDESTKAVCVGAVQFATGSSVDVAAVTARAKDVGCRVIVDVTQLAGAGPVSMRDWSADAVVCSGYKWLSSHGGVALLAMAPDLVEVTPRLVGWKGTTKPFSFEPTTLALAADARRFELSTIAYASAVGLLTSIQMLRSAGIPRIAEHARGLARRLIDGVEPLGWSPFRSPSDPASCGHIVALRHAFADVRHVQHVLAEEHRIVCSGRGGNLRVSVHLYNDASDIDTLVGALAALGDELDGRRPRRGSG